MAKKKTDNRYKIIPDKTDPKKWCVQLSSDTGDWSGIVYSYGEFSIIEPKKEDESPTFKFDIDVLHVPERLRGVQFPDERELEFRTLLGQILFDIIQKYGQKSNVTGGKLFIEIPNESE